MAALTTLLDDVMPELPGAGIPIVTHALFRAAEKFCKRSDIDARDLPAISTSFGVSTYALSAPTLTQLVSVMVVKLDGVPLQPAILDFDYDASRSPAYFTVSNDFVLTIYGKPNMDGVLSVRASVAPSGVGSDIPNSVITQWGAAIACGAKAAMMRMPKVSWADPSVAAMYQLEFEGAIDQARVSALVGRNNSGLSTSLFLLNGR